MSGYFDRYKSKSLDFLSNIKTEIVGYKKKARKSFSTSKLSRSASLRLNSNDGNTNYNKKGSISDKPAAEKAVISTKWQDSNSVTEDTNEGQRLKFKTTPEDKKKIIRQKHFKQRRHIDISTNERLVNFLDHKNEGKLHIQAESNEGKNNNFQLIKHKVLSDINENSIALSIDENDDRILKDGLSTKSCQLSSNGSPSDTSPQSPIKNQLEESNLTKRDYITFRNKLIRGALPSFLHQTYYDEESEKIFIGVKKGCIDQAKQFFIGKSPIEGNDDVFIIKEIGKLTSAADSAANNESEYLKNIHGRKLKNIQPGKAITSFQTQNNEDTIERISYAGIIKTSDDSVISITNYMSSISSNTCTVGGIMNDAITDQLYLVTAGHVFSDSMGFIEGNAGIVTSFPWEWENDLVWQYLGNKFKGHHGPYQDLLHGNNDLQSHEVLGMPEELQEKIFNGASTVEENTAADIAIIPLVTDIPIESIYPYYGTSQRHSIVIFRKDSAKLKKLPVQQIGAFSGLQKGSIIVHEFDLFCNETYYGDKYFLVASDELFAKVGDSGAWITDDISKLMDNDVCRAFGILHIVESECDRINPNTGMPYKVIAWCCRLDSCIDIVNKKWDLKLQTIETCTQNYRYRSLPDRIEYNKRRIKSPSVSKLTY